eukprot:1722661-Amphidinium_carterae.1
MHISDIICENNTNHRRYGKVTRSDKSFHQGSPQHHVTHTAPNKKQVATFCGSCPNTNTSNSTLRDSSERRGVLKVNRQHRQTRSDFDLSPSVRTDQRAVRNKGFTSIPRAYSEEAQDTTMRQRWRSKLQQRLHAR